MQDEKEQGHNAGFGDTRTHVHLNGFSFVCVSMWRFRCPAPGQRYRRSAGEQHRRQRCQRQQHQQRRQQKRRQRGKSTGAPKRVSSTSRGGGVAAARVLALVRLEAGVRLHVVGDVPLPRRPEGAANNAAAPPGRVV